MLRRDWLGLFSLMAVLPVARSQAQGRASVPIVDAHNHFGLLGGGKASPQRRLAEAMRDSGVRLLAWTVVPDGPFLRLSSRGLEQGRPIASGELAASFSRQMSAAASAAASLGLLVVKTPEDLSRVRDGTLGVVLSSEGADFLEGSLTRLDAALVAGLRHVQLVHYVQNPVGDIQTESPVHGGLSAFGKQLVPVLNDRGVLIDLAHSTASSVDQALEVSRVPMIWSHSFVSRIETNWRMSGWQARGLSEGQARKIARAGGAIGLWALGWSFGGGLDGYASEIIRMIELLGPEHVMFGTDQDGLPQGAVVNQLSDLRQIVDILAKRGVPEQTLRAVAYENYLRCLQAAMHART